MKTINLSGSGRAVKSKCFPHEKARPMQNHAIKAISDAWKSGYRYAFLEAPTGFGKSAVAVTLARENPKAFILVSTKGLQEQYVREKSHKTIEARGRSNFPCMNSKIRKCNLGPCRTGAECSHQPQREEEEPEYSVRLAETPNGFLWIKPGSRLCHYWRQKCDAINHGYPVLNYSYFLHETEYARDFGKRKLLVCDEAHNIEESLMSFIGFSISDNDLRLVNCRIPGADMPIPEWIETLKEWQRGLALEYQNTLEAMKNAYDPGRGAELVKKAQELSEKVSKSGFIAKELGKNPGNWVIDFGARGKVRSVSFRPIFVKQWAGKFFNMAELFLLQSATIIDADSMARGLGLPEVECAFIRAPSVFDVSKRPLFYRPIGRMSHNHIKGNLPKLVHAIGKIMENYPDQKGVVHTHSYKIQEHILEHLDSPRLIYNSGSGMRDPVIRRFIRSEEPLVLVTPSAYEGMDFKHDICRFQVLCKVPYPDLGDRQVRRRKDLDPGWYDWKTILRLVQTYGRGMRAENDWCDTYLLDASFAHIHRTSRPLFPRWFLDALRVFE